MFRIFKIKRTHFLIFSISIFAFSCSIAAEFILEKHPCQLCLISRFAYLTIAVVALLALKFRKVIIRRILFWIIALSLAFSFFHLGVENHWWRAPASCAYKVPSVEALKNHIIESVTPSCDKVNWEIFGISSTLLNFLLCAGLFWLICISYAIVTSHRRDEND